MLNVSYDASPIQEAAIKLFFSIHPELGSVEDYVNARVKDVLDARVQDFLVATVTQISTSDPAAIVAFLASYQPPK